MQSQIAFTCGVLCLLAMSAASPTKLEMLKHMKESIDKCVAESGVDPDLLDNAGKGEGVDDKKLHCFAACMMQDMNIMDEAGKFDKETAIEGLPDKIQNREATIAAIEACTKDEGDDPCSTAGLIVKCLHEKKADHIFHM